MRSRSCWKEKINTGILDGLKAFSASDFPDMILQISSCNTWNKLYLRDFIAEYDLQYQEIKTANDLCFVYSAIALAKRITVLSQPLVRHRVLHSGNLQSVKKKTPLDFFEALLLLRDNLQKFGVWEQLRQSYVNCALFHCIYNWETLDNKCRKHVKCRQQDISELLELGLHPESYYYDRSRYLKINKILFGDRDGGAGVIGVFKNILKRFLPPPVNSFNREIDGLRQYMQEISVKLEAQQKRMETQQKQLEVRQKQMASSIEKIYEQQAQMESKIVKQTETYDSKIYSTVTANKQAILQLHKQVAAIESGTLRNIPQPRLDYFVLNILDHCNLRCKGCDHFAAIAEKRFVELDDICRDLERMSQLTSQRVSRIGVMGGEPLLHPQLKKILAATRRWFPKTLVQVVSNGILMLKQDDEFWRTCRDNNIAIVVTKYPLNLDFERMEQTAKDWGVSFKYYGNTGEVIKTSYKIPMDINGQQIPVKSFWNCYHANHLPLLMEGKFYPCTVAPNARHFNRKFGTAMELEEGDWIDIYQVNNVEEILQFLSTPKPFCRYCRTTERSFGHKWERSKQQMDEWT